MSNILILSPTAISAIAVSRGSGGANLLTDDPKEVWVDSAVSTSANIDIDLGSAKSIDTVFLGYVTPPAAGATWTITGGTASYTTTTIKASGALRAIDSAGQAPTLSHAFWHGAAVNVRYLRITVTQPAGNPVLSAGIAMAGAAFVPTWNNEWGAGRRIIDTSAVSGLPSGGFAVVQGARKAAYAWTLGDLTQAEVDTLDAIQRDRGASKPVLVVEDPDATTGQRNRIHYGLLTSLRQYERRNTQQTKWEFSLEEWV